MPPQPFRPKLVADQIRLPENVLPKSGKAGGIERRLRFREHRAVRVVESAAILQATLMIERVRHERLRRGSPARPSAEVFLHQAAISAKLEIARALRHRRLDDLVAYHEQDVARTGSRMTSGHLPV